jgi:hypothetical protein
VRRENSGKDMCGLLGVVEDAIAASHSGQAVVSVRCEGPRA